MTARPTTAAPTVTQVSIRTMAAVYVLASAGFLIALREAPERSVVIGAVVALGIGIVVGHLTGVGRWFGQLAGLFVGVCAMVLLAGAMAFGASLFGTDTVVLDPPYGVTVWVGAAITGLDWCRVARLRGYVVIALGLVLIGVATTESWAIPVAIVWLVGALGAFTLLEGDRRAALAQATPGLVGEARNPRPQDLVTTIVVALALGLVAALVLSAPSCSPNGGGGRGSGSESGQGLGQGSGSGDFGTDSGGTSGTPDHRYVPDPTGRFLVPDDGSTDWDGLTTSDPIRVRPASPGDVPEIHTMIGELADFVNVADLQGEERIGGVLDELRRCEIGGHQRHCAEAFGTAEETWGGEALFDEGPVEPVHCFQRPRFIGADHNAIGIEAIVQSGAFAQELGIGSDREAHPAGLFDK